MRDQYRKAFFEVDHGGCFRSVVEFGECDRICCVSRNVKVSGNVTAQLPEAVSFHLYPLFPENAGGVRLHTARASVSTWPHVSQNSSGGKPSESRVPYCRIACVSLNL